MSPAGNMAELNLQKRDDSPHSPPPPPPPPQQQQPPWFEGQPTQPPPPLFTSWPPHHNDGGGNNDEDWHHHNHEHHHNSWDTYEEPWRTQISTYSPEPTASFAHKDVSNPNDTGSVVLSVATSTPYQSVSMSTLAYSDSSSTSVSNAAEISPAPTSSSPPPYDVNSRHGGVHIKSILLGAILGGGFVLFGVFLFGLYKSFARRKRESASAKKLEDSKPGDENGGGGSASGMQMAFASTNITIPSTSISGGPPIATTYASIHQSPTPASQAHEPVILNPFSDPTYNSSSGVEDYINSVSAHPLSSLQNPFAHPDDLPPNCTDHARPNSEGDFPPEYMTIDNAAVGGMAVEREDRFPFGDEALSDVSDDRRSSRLRGGFGNGFRGYNGYAGGGGANLGEFAEGSFRYIPQSDTSTLGGDHSSIDRGSSHHDSTVYEAEDEDNSDSLHVVDGHGYQPGNDHPSAFERI